MTLKRIKRDDLPSGDLRRSTREFKQATKRDYRLVMGDLFDATRCHPDAGVTMDTDGAAVLIFCADCKAQLARRDLGTAGATWRVVEYAWRRHGATA